MSASGRARTRLAGAIDLHVHVKPSVRNRLAGSLDLLEAAKAAGMRGVLSEDHDRSTVPDAWHAGALGEGIAEDEIAVMTRVNPARALGLEEEG